jgi:hypothetical protein
MTTNDFLLQIWSQGREGGREVVEKWLKYLMELMMMGFFSIFERDQKETQSRCQWACTEG